jgi:hypothetical protein
MSAKDNIRRWVEALESGEYQQGVGYLHDRHDNLFCCLGVACDLAYKEGVVARFQYDNDEPGRSSAWIVRYGKSELSTVLPDEVADWLGLADQNPEVEVDDSRYELTHVNDAWEMSFTEIAQLIRKNYL